MVHLAAQVHHLVEVAGFLVLLEVGALRPVDAVRAVGNLGITEDQTLFQFVDDGVF